jgi:hypothetical protein
MILVLRQVTYSVLGSTAEPPREEAATEATSCAVRAEPRDPSAGRRCSALVDRERARRAYAAAAALADTKLIAGG